MLMNRNPYQRRHPLIHIQV